MEALTLLKQLFCIFMFVSLLPMLIPILLFFKLYRSIGALLIKLNHPNMTLIDDYDNTFLNETLDNLGIINGIFEIDDRISVENLQAAFADRVLVARSNGVCIGRKFLDRVEYCMRRAVWIEDTKFDIARHVFQHGGPGAVYEDSEASVILSEYISQDFDHKHPRWSAILIHLKSGKSVIMLRIHHVYGDGVSLSRFLIQFLFDVSPTQEQASLKKFANQLSIHWIICKAILEGPYFLFNQMTASLGKNPLHGPKLTGKKIVTWTRGMPLEKIKTIKNLAGVTLNDVLLSGLTGALRAYLLEKHQGVGDLMKSVIPIDVRHGDSLNKIELRNIFAVVFFDIPLKEETHLGRLKKTSELMTEIKKSSLPFFNYWLARLIMSRMPNRASIWLTEDLFKKVTMVVSNVPGPQTKLMLTGKRVTRLNFWAPTKSNIGLSVSILTYNNEVFIGIQSDTAILKDPETLIKFYEEEIENFAIAVKSKET